MTDKNFSLNSIIKLINPETNIASSSQTNPEKTFASLDNSLKEKLEIFIRNELKENPNEWNSDHLEFAEENDREKWVKFHQLRDLVSYESDRYNHNPKIKTKRKNFLTDEEWKLADKVKTILGLELGIYSDSETDSESEEEENQLAVSTIRGQEVIKNEISQELIKAKEIFESAEIGSVNTDHLKEELTEKLLELHERRGNEAEINLMSYSNAFSNRTSNQKWRKEKAEKVAEWGKKYEEFETKLEAMKPSKFQQALEKMGLVSLKNTLVNTSAIVGAIVGAVVVLYAISWMWKHLIKPTYYNFKGEPKPPAQSPNHSPKEKNIEPEKVGKEKEADKQTEVRQAKNRKKKKKNGS